MYPGRDISQIRSLNHPLLGQLGKLDQLEINIDTLEIPKR